jgi:hypothetical protein
MISSGVVLLVLAFRPVRCPLRRAEADELQPLEILDHWAPLSVDRPEPWLLDLSRPGGCAPEPHRRPAPRRARGRPAHAPLRLRMF